MVDKPADRLIRTIASKGSPIIEGEQVTFVWKGTNPPQLIGDFTDWERGEPLKLERYNDHIWIKSIILPLDGYLEYAFVRDGRRVLDPYNHHLTPNGFGRYNHYFYLPEYRSTRLVAAQRDVPRGIITRHSIPTWELVGGMKRKVHLYKPVTSGPTPLLVVLDGQDYIRRAHLPAIVDNLIARNRIAPISLALVENGRKTRVVEYCCSEGCLTFLSEVVVSLAREKLYLIDVSQSPGAYGILGASMGGLMALYAGLRIPDIFGNVLIQSGGFHFGSRDLVVFDLVKYVITKPLKIWMEVGKFDIKSILDANIRMFELLKARGHDVAFNVYNAGHNYPAWRDGIGRGLIHMFGIKVNGEFC